MSIWREINQGQQDATQMGLHESKNNWTPLLIYIHCSRLIIGAILGFVAGFSIGLGIALLI